MALTDYDKKNLSASDQKKIQDATDKWNAANAKGDTAGMASAAAEAAAVRNNAGYKTDSSGNYKSSSGGSYGGTTPNVLSGVAASNKNTNNNSNNNTTYSPYTGGGYTIGSDYGKQQAQNMGIGQSWTASDGAVWTKQNDGTISVNYNGQTYNNAWTPTDYGVLGTQQIQAGLPYSYVQDTLNNRVNKALNTEGLEGYAYDNTYLMMQNYINAKMAEESNAKIKAEYEQLLSQLEQGRPEAYQSKYDPQIDAMLNKILNRDDFSYDVMNDPLYQQYAQMYQREGDRAMKETMAEAAAGAGGMNTYAVTAAQQANSYYNSQLNDKIPELYQLAYNMYLDDKESQVQDLGLLMDMDESQYNRYRDTMNDYYNDKTFAYDAYNDAVQQGNWQKTYDYNSMWDNINFNNDNYLTNREWDDSEEEREINNNRSDRDSAKEEVWSFIDKGIMPSADLIKRAEMDEATVQRYVDAVNADKASKKSTSGGGGVSGTDKVGGGDETEDNFNTIKEDCDRMILDGDKLGAAAYAKECYDAGLITTKQYKELLSENNPVLNMITNPGSMF